MSERQKHGFDYEERVKKKYKIEGVEGYSNEWDGVYKGIPVSIKTKRKGSSIEMADFFRNANKKEDFILVVGFWEGEKDNIVEEYTLHINKYFWRSQFNKDLVEEYVGIFDGITNSYDDDDRWRVRMTDAKNKWGKINSIINVHFKRDHKKQKRVQCSIKNKDFYNVLLKYYRYDLDTRE